MKNVVLFIPACKKTMAFLTEAGCNFHCNASFKGCNCELVDRKPIKLEQVVDEAIDSGKK
jgi:hypothetical protein